MKITVISAVFLPEPVVSAKTSYDLAVGLTQQNDPVRVITNFPNRPAGKLYDGYRRAFYSASRDPAGFRVLRCFSLFSRESSLISRWLENISFGITSALALLFSPRPDVVYSNTWPIFATGFTCLACKIRKIPLVLSVQDMYPESLVIQGRLKPSDWLYKVLLRIDKWITKQAKAIILISKNFASNYTQLRDIDPQKVHIIPNWVDQNSVILEDKNKYRGEASISTGDFVIVYGGNIGKAAGVEAIIEAIGQLDTGREIVLVIAGSGSQLAPCQKLAAGINNARIIFHSPWKAEETSKVLAAADIVILPTQGTQSLVSVPSKLLSYLLAAKPVLAGVLPESDTAQVIETAGCGWIVPPGNIHCLVEKLEAVASLPAQTLEKMGSSGREYALQTFTTESSLPRVISIIENVAQEGCR